MKSIQGPFDAQYGIHELHRWKALSGEFHMKLSCALRRRLEHKSLTAMIIDLRDVILSD
jgi:hypothetical protein